MKVITKEVHQITGQFKFYRYAELCKDKWDSNALRRIVTNPATRAWDSTTRAILDEFGIESPNLWI